MKNERTRAMLDAFRHSRNALFKFRENHFPTGAFVSVEDVGCGVVAYQGENAPDFVAVRLENGNVWHYGLDKVKRISHRETPRAVRRMWLKRQGYQLLNTR